MYVNPPQVIGGSITLPTAQMAECDYENNWSVNHGGACVPLCTGADGMLTAAQVSTCSFAVPAGAGTVWDVSNPTVQYSAAGSMTRNNVTWVPGAWACDPTTGGFYYDSNTAPTKITLCPATCAPAKMTGAVTYYHMGCPSTYTTTMGPLTPFSAPFVGAAACPEGTTTQWDYLAYSTVTPFTSTVTFAVQTGTTPTMLTPATPITVATAHSVWSPYTTDTEYCPLGTLPSAAGVTCPVDLFDALNCPAQYNPAQPSCKGTPSGPAQNPYLNLVITLTPTATAGPVVNSFAHVLVPCGAVTRRAPGAREGAQDSRLTRAARAATLAPCLNASATCSCA
jgi:hypothetical protein